jgi:hypothetical protein
MRSPSRFFRTTQFVGLVLVGLALLFGRVASGAEGASSSTRTGAASIPTWGNLYDWPNGHGYVGWHAASSSPDDYGTQPALGGRNGLWLWAKGGQHVYTESDYAEWTYSAPGTTRLQSTTLSFAYRNKLLAHHCIEIGFRTLAGALITHQDFCQPSHPPDSQDLTNVRLDDPVASAPSSKVLYLRIHVDCGGAATCTKTIPQLDPLATGGYVRFLKVAMTLVDDDLPVTSPSGPLWDIRDQFIDGTQRYGVTLGATDAGSGVASSSLTHSSTYPSQTDSPASQAAPCDKTHMTTSLDARICPPEFSWQTSVDTNAYPEGPNRFTEAASDVAGNVGSTQWSIYIDRTAPDSVEPSGSLWDLRGQTTPGSTEFVTVDAHDPGADVQKASGIARVWVEEVGSGVIASSDNADCTTVICPDSYSAALPVELGQMPEGDHTFVVKASDLVGHVTTGPSWTVTIRHDPGDDNVGPADDGGPVAAGLDQTPDGGSEGYDPTTDPDPACDAYVDLGVTDWCTDSSFSETAPVGQPDRLAGATSTTSYSGCNVTAVFWSVFSPPKHLSDALAAHNLGAGCASYYFAQTGPGRSPVCLTGLRPDWPSNFHAAPVFNWKAWADWVKFQDPEHKWFNAGVEFRNEMAAMGCDADDKWFLNEMPTSWHTGATQSAVRGRILDALRGLYHGPANDNVSGFSADVVESQQTSSLTVYKASEQSGFAQVNFWRLIRTYVDGFVKETYDRCSNVCVPNQTAATIADRGVNNYSYHQRFLALAAPSTSTYAPVKTTLAQDYMPLLNAFWKSPRPVYDSQLQLPQMTRMIRQEVYSARRAASFAYGSGGRIGFAWRESYDGVADDDAAATQLAENLAIALHDAYASSGFAGKACIDNDGSGSLYVGCPPAGKFQAAFNAQWDRFKTWGP